MSVGKKDGQEGRQTQEVETPEMKQSEGEIRKKEKEDKGRKRDVVVQWSHPGTVNRVRANPR